MLHVLRANISPLRMPITHLIPRTYHTPTRHQLTFTSSEEDNNDDPVEDNNANDETFKPESESDGDDEEALMDLEKVLEESSYEDVSSDEVCGP